MHFNFYNLFTKTHLQITIQIKKPSKFRWFLLFLFCIILYIMKKDIIFALLGLMLVSCTPSFFTSYFAKIEDLSKLDGRYYAKSDLELGRDTYRRKAHLLRLFNMDEDIQATYYVDVKFEEPNKVHLTYPILKNDSLVIENKTFTGKRKKKSLEITFSNQDIYIPLIYSSSNIDKLKIGLDKKNNSLLLEKYTYFGGSILIFGDGFGGERYFPFYKYDEYKAVKSFYKNGKFGISRADKIIVEPIYDYAYDFENNYIIAGYKGKEELLDIDGKQIISPRYDEIAEILPLYGRGGLLGTFFKVMNNGKIGLVNESGKEIIPTKYDDIRSYDGYFSLKLNNKYGYATTEGVLYPAIYDLLYNNHAYCRNRVYHAAKRDGEEYILDNEGNEYKSQKKFPKVWISQQVCPDLETKRKVSPDEDEK